MKNFLTTLRAASLWILLLPYAVGLTGAASNQLVLIANHDTFPVMMNSYAAAHVMPEGIDEEGHVLMTSQTHLNFLADVFDFHDGWMSIGDLLLMLGSWLSTFCPFVWAYVVISEVTRT